MNPLLLLTILDQPLAVLSPIAGRKYDNGMLSFIWAYMCENLLSIQKIFSRSEFSFRIDGLLFCFFDP